MFHASATVVVGLCCVLEAGLREHICVLQVKASDCYAIWSKFLVREFSLQRPPLQFVQFFIYTKRSFASSSGLPAPHWRR